MDLKENLAGANILLLACAVLGFGRIANAQSAAVLYPGDVLPQSTAPAWSELGSGTSSVAGGTLTISAGSNVVRYYQRNELLSPATEAVARFRVKVVSSDLPYDASFTFSDGTKYGAVGLTTTQIGFVDLSNTFISSSSCPGVASFPTTDDFHTYEFRKDGNSTFRLFRDGVEVVTMPYSCMPTNPESPRIWWGKGSLAGNGNSQWDFVTYQLGTTNLFPAVAYAGDALPQSTVPSWTELGGGSSSAASGALTISAGNNITRFYQRDEAPSPATDAVARFRVKVVSSDLPYDTAFTFSDGTKYGALGFTSTQIGFVDLSNTFINSGSCPGVASFPTTDAFHTYEFRKEGNSAFRLLRDGVEVVTMPYSCMPTNPESPRIWWGKGSLAGNGDSQWDYVLYELGATTLDGQAPRITAVSPAAGAQVGGIDRVSLSFDKPMRPASISAGTFRLVGTTHGAVTPEYVAWDGTTNAATLFLGTPLVGTDETYTITAAGTGTGAMTDPILNPLDGEFSGGLPSGDGAPGGDFVSSFTVTSAASAEPVRVLTFNSMRAEHCGSIDWTFTTGNDYAVAEAALLDPGNFGPGGVIQRSVQFLPPVPEITCESLANADVILLTSHVGTLDLQPAEMALISEFVLRGGGLLAIYDQAPLELATTFGGTFGGEVTTGNCGSITSAASPASGPFGSASGCISPNHHDYLGFVGAEGTAFVSNSDWSPVGVTFTHGDGRAVLLCDDEAFGTESESGCALSAFNTNARTLLLNMFAAVIPSAAWPGYTKPAEIGGVLFSDKSTLVWQACPQCAYNVARGSLTELPVGSGPSDACLPPGSSPDPTATDPATPAADAGFWYLARGRNACGAGTYGYQSNGTERNTAACP